MQDVIDLSRKSYKQTLVIESTFTASSAAPLRCPSQPSRPHVVYSPPLDPANPKGSQEIAPQR